METKVKISLPERFEEVKLSYVAFEDGYEILRYCHSCTKKPNCEMNKTIRYSIEEDFSYLSERFVAVRVPTPHKFPNGSERKIFCAYYENPQLKLPGISLTFSDGIKRLIEIAEEEKVEYIEKNGSTFKDSSF